MRHKIENLCLVVNIPEPREPSGEDIEFLMPRPLVEVTMESWANGVIYRTREYSLGQFVQSTIALSVSRNDNLCSVLRQVNHTCGH